MQKICIQKVIDKNMKYCKEFLAIISVFLCDFFQLFDTNTENLKKFF